MLMETRRSADKTLFATPRSTAVNRKGTTDPNHSGDHCSREVAPCPRGGASWCERTHNSFVSKTKKRDTGEGAKLLRNLGSPNVSLVGRATKPCSIETKGSGVFSSLVGTAGHRESRAHSRSAHSSDLTR